MQEIFNLPKKLFTILSCCEIPSERLYEIRIFPMKNPRKSLGSVGCNLTYLPHGTKM